MSERMNEEIYKKSKLCTFKNGVGESVLKVVKRHGQKGPGGKTCLLFTKFLHLWEKFMSIHGQGAPIEKRHENLEAYQKIIITASHPPNPQVW